MVANADLCIDGFHVVSWAIEALDTLRKDIKKQIKLKESSLPSIPVGRPASGVTVRKPTPARVFKSTKYALGKNPNNLTSTQNSILDEIIKTNPVLYSGYLLKEGLRAVFQCTGDSVGFELKKWLSWACRCRIPVFVELSKKIKRHYNGIVATVRHTLSNARIESMNNKIKVLIRKAYGFRNMQNMIDMIMLVCSILVHDIKPTYANR